MRWFRFAMISCGILLFSLDQSLAAKEGAVEKPTPNQVVEMMKLYYNDLFNGPFEEALKRRNRELEAAFHQYILEEIKHEQTKTANTERVVWWTNLSANTTFVIAHILLGLGIVLAYREWRNAQQVRKKGKGESMEIEIKMESLAMKGVQAGYIILAVSLIFYFMYLKFVYPIIIV